MLCVSGCTTTTFPVDNPNAPSQSTPPAGPATTTTKITPAGNGVSMLDLLGSWFFILRDADGNALFTQRGDFELRDDDGKIMYDDTWYVQGFKADDQGTLRTDKLLDLKIVIGQPSPVNATSQARLKGNVNPEDAEVGDVIDTTFKVYDADGESTEVYVAAMLTAKNAAGTQLRFDVRLGGPKGVLLGRETFGFDTDGNIEGQAVLRVSSGSPALSFNVQLDAMEASSRKDPSLELKSQDGIGNGTLASYLIGNDGSITGKYTNGLKLLLGQFMIAQFDDPAGLAPVKGRSDLFTETEASGSPRPAISVAD
jgi:flagellar hook protein FlgE